MCVIHCGKVDCASEVRCGKRIVLTVIVRRT